MKKTIIFDMDGLMFNSEPLWAQAFIKATKKVGYNVSVEIQKKTIGSNGKTFEKIMKENVDPNFPTEKFNEIYFKTMIELINEKGVEKKKGLDELINYLIKNKYKIAIASSSRTDIIEANLNKANINKNIFSAIISGNDLKDSKPNPEIFIKTCKKLNENPNNTIVLEDSNNGIIAAYKAGCIPILIPDTDKIKKETLNMAKYKFKNLIEVIELLET